jgi:hypothetical protein
VVVGAGTGGTAATIGCYVRHRRLSTLLSVVDPEGSAFFDSWRDADPTVTGTASAIEGSVGHALHLLRTPAPRDFGGCHASRAAELQELPRPRVRGVRLLLEGAVTVASNGWTVELAQGDWSVGQKLAKNPAAKPLRAACARPSARDVVESLVTTWCPLLMVPHDGTAVVLSAWADERAD